MSGIDVCGGDEAEIPALLSEVRVDDNNFKVGRPKTISDYIAHREEKAENIEKKRAADKMKKEQKLQHPTDRHLLAKYNLQNTCVRYTTWKKQNVNGTIEDYKEYLEKHVYIYYNGKVFLKITDAGKAAGLTERECGNLQQTIKRYHPNDRNKGFHSFLASHENGSTKRTVYEKQLDEILTQFGYEFEEEKKINQLVDNSSIDIDNLISQVENNLKNITPYLKEYNVNLKNIGNYRYDSFMKPNHDFPKGALFETDGSQHFQQESLYKGRYSYSLTNEEFVSQILRDKIKNIAAKLLDIPLLRLPYYSFSKNGTGWLIDEIKRFSAEKKGNDDGMYYEKSKTAISSIDRTLADLLFAS